MYKIVDKEQLAAGISRLVFDAPLIAKKRKAGNFIMLRVMEGGERIPITIADSDSSKGTITLYVQAVGKTTKLLTAKNIGESIQDLVGPLGVPTHIEHFGTVACIGGGVGTAEIYPIAKALREAGNHVIGIVGARNKDLIILENEMRKICNEYYITTDDGSAGMKGFVSDRLKQIIDGGTKISCVYAVGPIPMMKVCSNVTKPYGIRTYVSLNPLMVDGTGMCGGCRVTVGGKMKFACVDGPEFDGHQVDFDELIMRNRTYGDMEKKSMSDHECRLQKVADTQAGGK
ncbi:MAG TPA: sulfide/dihydroorotate dehydrogenase-like FAD/NAD-binding protein [Candidatus Ozemobacteraceae bacterium]|nr:sulfide/dihydroorotate dehydrogenase-like FAD/NAD-binding protein [Candidatus Ozemobacteraceae bacterium]